MNLLMIFSNPTVKMTIFQMRICIDRIGKNNYKRDTVTLDCSKKEEIITWC